MARWLLWLVVVASFAEVVGGFVVPGRQIGRPVTTRRETAVVPRMRGDDPFVGNPFFVREEKSAPGFPVVPLVFTAFVVIFPGVVFKVLNGIFLLVLVLPPLAAFAFQQWSRRNVITSPCPRCSMPVSSLKTAPTVCFNCATPLVPTTDGDAWRVRSKFDTDDDFGDLFSSPAAPTATRGRPSSTVIDVEADVE
mmetsp:Transcript_250/g.640  ORF Transcript_250/g.640 Transcript_250/m.640 type:complete len:194 (-) Transcript_250:133-714(-)|eukprot:CAMPEP_0197423256 /NCGR_PEP_ID=MMETSP1170-20131217/20415_1 /TAXON_ID=54406 /ORGANISM="Sarcinochrysis sp, Strain CCMP770" /LENGTH=193 /DNA_ID=CAMNT_0042950659 /DNA_START=31 /DNA_END=612 /DNA_ORIENTATION=-